MRWDDLQLLRLIDELESGQTGQLMSGYSLMQAASDGRVIDWESDCRTFARELLLARDAGYLEWTDQFNPGVRALDPLMEAQQWLQQIHDIRLTIAGRDRRRSIVREFFWRGGKRICAPTRSSWRIKGSPGRALRISAAIRLCVPV